MVVLEDVEEPPAPLPQELEKLSVSGEGKQPPAPSSTDSATLAAAEELKRQGNKAFGCGVWAEAEELYSRALEAEAVGREPTGDSAAASALEQPEAGEEAAVTQAVPPQRKERAVYFANRAACRLALDRVEEAVSDCSAALEVDGTYVKALLRRAAAYERQGELESLEKASTDLARVLELEPSNAVAKEKLRGLAPALEAKREAVKKEMLDQLKGFGNTILGKFGLSIDNFKAEKDPNTGSYSVQFVQNPAGDA